MQRVSYAWGGRITGTFAMLEQAKKGDAGNRAVNTNAMQIKSQKQVIFCSIRTSKQASRATKKTT